MKNQYNNIQISNIGNQIDTTQKTIAILGPPQSGKSTIFRLLTDFKSHGYDATFEVTEAETKIKNKKIIIVDLPGIQSLSSSQFSEKIAINYLLKNKIDLIINMIDSTNLVRGLKLTTELLDLGIPVIICLNFQDEAQKRGIIINEEILSNELGCPTISLTARSGNRMKELVNLIEKFFDSNCSIPKPFQYTQNIERYINSLEKLILKANIKLYYNPRFYAVKTIEDPTYIPELSQPQTNKIINEIEDKISQELNQEPFEFISHIRHIYATELANNVIRISKNKVPFQDRMDTLISHPIFGYIAFIAVLLLFFVCIFLVGNFLASLIDPILARIGSTFAPLEKSSPFLWASINGAYQGILGALGIVLPYFLPLVLFTSLLEETGYMSRVVLLIDGLMHKIGLHGKSILPFMLGMGCSVPALYATRMLENPRDRVITAILIPFIPCSARLTVIFALSAALTGPFWAVIILLYIILLVGIIGKILSVIMPGSSGLIMEIVPLKFPSFKNSLIKTWIKIKDFLGDALIFLILGGIVLGWVEYFNISSIFDTAFSPIISGLLDLPEKIGSTLVFGFLRKELILVMTYQTLGVSTLSNLPMTITQVVVFIVFVCLYFPCLSTFIVLWKEFKWKIAISSALFSLLIATISSFIFKIILNLIYI
jgi:ferrous iron transport protein B